MYLVELASYKLRLNLLSLACTQQMVLPSFTPYAMLLYTRLQRDIRTSGHWHVRVKLSDYKRRQLSKYLDFIALTVYVLCPIILSPLVCFQGSRAGIGNLRNKVRSPEAYHAMCMLA